MRSCSVSVRRYHLASSLCERQDSVHLLMVDTMSEERVIFCEPARRTRRTYSGEFKAQLVAACQQAGASVAALALHHGINANLLHRWRREHERRLALAGNEHAGGGSLQTEPMAQTSLAAPLGASAVAHSHTAVAQAAPAFVAMALHPPSIASSCTAPADIRIECCHHGTPLTVHWPVAAAAECVRWLSSLWPTGPS